MISQKPGAEPLCSSILSGTTDHCPHLTVPSTAVPPLPLLQRQRVQLVTPGGHRGRRLRQFRPLQLHRAFTFSRATTEHTQPHRAAAQQAVSTDVHSQKIAKNLTFKKMPKIVFFSTNCHWHFQKNVKFLAIFDIKMAIFLRIRL